MTAPRRTVDDALYSHFLTFNIHRNRKLLDHDHPKRILLGVLNEVLDEMNAKCVGFVIMPEHVHAIVWFPRTGQLSRFMHEWKRRSSSLIRTWYREHAAQYFDGFGEGTRLWQPKSYACAIYSRSKQEEKLDYMHLNPSGVGWRPRQLTGSGVQQDGMPGDAASACRFSGWSRTPLKQPARAQNLHPLRGTGSGEDAATGATPLSFTLWRREYRQ